MHAVAAEAALKAAMAPTNPSGIWPTEFNCVVKQEIISDTIEKIMPDGRIFKLMKPTEMVDKEQIAAIRGTLLAISPLAFTYETWPEGCRKPKVGDQVIFAKYAGMRVDGKDGEKYLIVKDKDVSAILD